MLDVGQVRHPKEATYFIIAAVTGGFLWLVLLALTAGTLLIFLLFFALFLFIAQQFTKARVFGNAVLVNNEQYPEINQIVQQSAAQLGLTKIPDVFIVNGDGMVNAFAIRFLSGRYVLLMSSLVDLMLKHQAKDELTMIIGHELGHHAAGHVAWWKNLLILPARIVPFLGTAYLRSCEFTSDRIGQVLCGSGESAQRALVSLACGSNVLADQTNIDAFARQETRIPGLFGFLLEIFSTHPRMTKRIAFLRSYM